MKYIYLSIFALLFISCSQERSHIIAKIPEASGIDYCRSSDTLIVANDEGSYYEIALDGDIIKRQRLGKYDLEGVVCTDNKLIFAVENSGLLLVGREDDKIKKITLDKTYKNKKLHLFGKNSGVEGIAKNGNTLYLAKQADKKKDSFIAVVHLEHNRPKITNLIKHKIQDTSGLTFHNGYLYIISDKKDTISQYDLQKNKILYSVKLPKAAQEGIAFDGKGYLYIADDDGHVLKYSKRDLVL